MSKLIAADRMKDTVSTLWVELEQLVLQYKPINLGQGFPDVLPPAYVTQAMVHALTSDSVALHQRTKGCHRLVQAVAKLYSKLIGREIDPETETLISAGAANALYCAVMGHVNPGDEVIIVEPCFSLYGPTVLLAEAIPVPVPLRPKKTGEIKSSGDWILDYDELRSKFNEKTKAILLSNPANPLGKVYRREELEMIAEIAKQWDVLVISDEVYEWLVFDGNQHFRIVTLPDMWERTITIGSAGKTFGVTGWRLGWAYGPPNLIHNCQMVFDHIINCVAVPVQEAMAICFEMAIERLGQPECCFNEVSRAVEAGRDFAVAKLLDAGLRPVVPQAGYFVLADYTTIGSKVDFDEGGG